MPSLADILDDLDPGMHFEPSDDELVKFYLLPRVRGQPDLFPGLVVEDDTAANTQPWNLFRRHGRPDDDKGFFFVHDPKGGDRPDRRCTGGGTWKSQRSEREDSSHEVVVDGETFKWKRHMLNLHMGTGKKSGGSTGWVMHEYSISSCRSHIKLCTISFSGYGQKRKRVPDGEPAPQRQRVSDWSPPSCSGTTTAAFDDQGIMSTAHASGDQELVQVQTTNAWVPQEPWELLSDDDIAEVLDILNEAPVEGEPAPQLGEQVPTEEPCPQQVPAMDQSSSGVPDIGVVEWEGYHFCFE